MVDPPQPAPATGFHIGRVAPVRRYFYDRTAGHEIPPPDLVRGEFAGGNLRTVALPLDSSRARTADRLAASSTGHSGRAQKTKSVSGTHGLLVFGIYGAVSP